MAEFEQALRVGAIIARLPGEPRGCEQVVGGSAALRVNHVQSRAMPKHGTAVRARCRLESGAAQRECSSDITDSFGEFRFDQKLFAAERGLLI